MSYNVLIYRHTDIIATLTSTYPVFFLNGSIYKAPNLKETWRFTILYELNYLLLSLKIISNLFMGAVNKNCLLLALLAFKIFLFHFLIQYLLINISPFRKNNDATAKIGKIRVKSINGLRKPLGTLGNNDITVVPLRTARG